ncbi:MAG TPA: transporter, partial [Afipia sp.]|nr:transporter [Afipia sp.]HBF54343.1 transporter [Afipia sp.]
MNVPGWFYTLIPSVAVVLGAAVALWRGA